jgi:nicotinamidase-related amidase
VRRALVVIDMIEDFVREGGALYCGPSMAKIVPVIQRELGRARAAGEPVVYLKDDPLPDDADFQQFPPHAISGTAGARIVPEVAPRDGETVIRSAATPVSSEQISTSRCARRA